MSNTIFMAEDHVFWGLTPEVSYFEVWPQRFLFWGLTPEVSFWWRSEEISWNHSEVKHRKRFLEIIVKWSIGYQLIVIFYFEVWPQRFHNATKMGCHPVAWKLARAAMKRFPQEISKWRTRYRRHFRACQYTAAQRLAYSFAWPIWDRPTLRCTRTW